MLKRVFTEVGKANIGTRKATAKKPWITDEIIQLIDERRQYKNAKGNRGIQKYKTLRNEINRRCRKAKAKRLQERCEEIEKEMVVGRTDVAYRKVKSMIQLISLAV